MSRLPVNPWPFEQVVGWGALPRLWVSPPLTAPRKIMTTHVLHWFLTEPHWLAAQGLIQNLSGAFMVWGGLMMWHHSCDAHLWCWRPGKHRVAGTTWSTCSNHTREHDAMFARHAEKHPDR